MHGAGRHHAQPLALDQQTVLDADQRDHAEIGVVPAVDQQRAQFVGVSLRRRQPFDQRLQHIVDTFACLGGNLQRVGRVEADNLFDLLADPVRFGGR